MELVLPVPPSANHYWRDCVKQTRGGKAYVQRYKTAEAREYQAAVANRARLHVVEPLTGPVTLTVTWFRKIRRGDLDNRLKVLLDAMNGVLYVDDDQVVEIHAFRKDDRLNPRVEVEVSAMTGEGVSREVAAESEAELDAEDAADQAEDRQLTQEDGR